MIKIIIPDGNDEECKIECDGYVEDITEQAITAIGLIGSLVYRVDKEAGDNFYRALDEATGDPGFFTDMCEKEKNGIVSSHIEIYEVHEDNNCNFGFEGEGEGKK